MDKIKGITQDRLRVVVTEQGFPELFVAKDYFVTVLLYLLRDVEGLYFKGGTALNKIFLDYARLSEDIDYTVTRDIKDLKKEIETIIISSKLFGKVTQDKNVDHYLRLIVAYKDPFGNSGTVFIDLNKKASLHVASESHSVPHFYEGSIPPFSVKTLNTKELIAEKMRAAISRNKPRDHFDLYQIIQRKLPLDFDLVAVKCKEADVEFDIIKMFNKAQTLKRRWEEDMQPLLRDPITFQEVMQLLATYFKLKEYRKSKKEQ